MDMVRQYRHVMNLVKAGRGHDPLGILATHPGELTGLCHACPHESINIPNDISSLPLSSRLVYACLITLFLTELQMDLYALHGY
jgi:hypothetical protein